MGNTNKPKLNQSKIDIHMLSRAVIGGGCFWCTEAVFQRLKGVQKVQSGYAGGQIKEPTYSQICTGKTGHAQVIRIFYNPTVISYHNLLYIFFHLHDPTTLNRQGNDAGTQYRSTIMYQTEQQRDAARQVLEQVTKQGKYPGAPSKIVTQITKLDHFYEGEDYHQNYYNENSSEGYCKAIIKPKLSKFKSLFQKYIDSNRM